MQVSLKGLFSGKRESVAEPKKRPVGRPKKVSAKEVVAPPEELRSEVAALSRRAQEPVSEVAALGRGLELPAICDEAADAVIETQTPHKKAVES